MGLTALAAVFGVGLIAGLLSGLIGIGGGVLIVPFLYLFYGHPQWFGVVVPGSLTAVVAHATSLFVIFPTSLRGAFVFHKEGQIEWRVVAPIGLASVAAAAVGASVATRLPAELLKLLFGVVLIASGLRLVQGKASEKGATVETPRPLRRSLPLTLAVGVAVGLFSALLGVGGGIVSIPLLVYVIGIPLRRVAGTSLAIIVITAAAGALVYMINGWGQAGLPPWSLGYVHAGAAVAMFAGSLLSVRWGVELNQRLRVRALAGLFAALFVLVGIRLVLLNFSALSTLFFTSGS